MKLIKRIVFLALIVLVFNIKQCREYDYVSTEMCDCASELIALSNDTTSFISDFEKYELAALRFELPAFDTLEFNEKEQLKNQIMYLQGQNTATYRAKMENALFPHTLNTSTEAIKLTETFIANRYVYFGVPNIDPSKIQEGAKKMAGYFVCPQEIRPGLLMRFFTKNESRVKREVKEKCPDFDKVVYKIF